MSANNPWGNLKPRFVLLAPGTPPPITPNGINPDDAKIAGPPENILLITLVVDVTLLDDLGSTDVLGSTTSTGLVTSCIIVSSITISFANALSIILGEVSPLTTASDKFGKKGINSN